MHDEMMASRSSTKNFPTADGKPFVVDSAVEHSMRLSADGDYLPIFTSRKYIEDIKAFEVRPTDIFVVTWPRSGTTWTQYILTQIVHGPASVHQHNLFRTNFHMEITHDMSNMDNTEGRYKVAERAPDPRLLKSHLQMRYLPTQLFRKRPKIIYVARNPKDAAVSYYNLTEMESKVPNYKNWADFYEHSIRGFVPYGDWFSHVLPWWELRHEPNVLFMKYEDIQKDTKATVERLSRFLERPLSREEVEVICRQSTFSEMAKNRKANPDRMNISTVVKGSGQKFMRKGTVGDWRKYYTPAQNDHFDALYRQRMEGSGLTFEFGPSSVL